MRVSLLIAICLMLLVVQSEAQEFKHAGEYIEYISKSEADFSKKYLSYLSEMSHGRNARKQERRRTQLLEACWNAKGKINEMPYWEKDQTLKKASVEYFDLLYKVLNEDYAKIVNMEEIAEQSYDNMEAYLLAQEKANERLRVASEEQDSVTKQFAKSHNITIIDAKNEISEKMKVAGEVNTYYHQVYLIFFKSYKQDNYMVEALNAGNINNIEQNRSALLEFSQEGLASLDTIRAYKSDASLVNACKKLLQHYKATCEKLPGATDYIMKNEAFGKAKKEMDRKGNRTKEEVDKFNKMVNEVNEASKKYNKTMQEMNATGTELLNRWNETVTQFFDRHMPFYE